MRYLSSYADLLSRSGAGWLAGRINGIDNAKTSTGRKTKNGAFLSYSCFTTFLLEMLGAGWTQNTIAMIHQQQRY
jgi:hypothetical protein